MTTLVDAYGLAAFVADEPAAAEVEELLRGGAAAAVAVNLAEAVDVCRRVHHLPAAAVRGVLEPIVLAGHLPVIASGEAEAWRAADLRADRYHRSRCPLSIADCLLLAHAALGDAAVATADPHVAAVARELGVELVPLPDTTGALP